jgi:iron(III) transport system substrate-binding protein
LVYYGTLPIDEFLPLARVFNGRYRSMALQQYFSPRDGILSRTLTEARAGRHAVDVVQVDLSYGFQLLNANLVHPYPISGRNQYFDGTFDPAGYWHSMYYLTTALIYNTNSVKAEQAPKSYEELLSPAWKGKMLFDPEAGYILAAMEAAWGREKAVGYLARLAKQDLSYRRGGTLTTQVVTSGEYPIGIAINGETSAAIREKGAPLGFKVLAPSIVKPEGLFLAKNAPHPHAALLFAEWVLSEEAQSFLAGKLGKGSAMKGAKSKFKDFQIKPDFVVSPKLGANLQSYIQDFRKIMGAP